MMTTIEPEAIATVKLEPGVRARAIIGFSDEKRGGPRFRQRMVANVIGHEFDEVQHCLTEDISESGLFVHVPASSALRVGQRIEVELQDAEAGPRSALSGERRFATVVRTEPVRKGPAHLIGAALCFDQPLYL
jgi:hypothetical protein